MMRINVRIKKSTATMLLLIMLLELFTPTVSYALTSGPSQPEMQSFEPVGTTDMVNAFSGDFVYNIPLMDVEGYPINIAYHSGVSVEQEASWVGLGFNINPGNINHGVRGIPDDFDGEKIEKTITINEETKKRFGLLISLEVAGVGVTEAYNKIKKALKINVGGSLDMGLSVSNYTGVSASLGFGSNMGVGNEWISAGVNMGASFSTDNGADIDFAAYGGVSNSKAANSLNTTVNGSFGKGYNSREGLKYTSFGINPSFSFNQKWNDSKGKERDNRSRWRPEGVNNTIVPISMQNFVPVITNATFMESNFFQFKMGIEASATIYPNFGGNLSEEKIRFDPDGTRKAYGFFNLQHAAKEDITDFARDRDGRFNRDIQYLPSGNMTYDVYSVNGQGTAGNFRGFRNDIGTVFDPYTNSDIEATSNMVELGVGNIFEAGWDRVSSYTSASAGPWNKYKNNFSDKKKGSLHEPYYLKQAGELSEANPDYKAAIKGTGPLQAEEVRTLNASPMEALGDDNIRSKRANLLSFLNAKEASIGGVGLQHKIQNYPNPGSMTATSIDRMSGSRKAHHASEFTQLLPDGRRYVYGIPAMNNEQVEYVMSCNAPATNDGQVDIGPAGQQISPYGSGGPSSPIGQKMHMKTKTPAYAHSYLLSGILSSDYSDLTGNGITDDDLGDFTKFNYTRKNENYRWRTPFETGKARFDRGVNSDCHDDKATFVIGSKEIWMLHSVESKNYIAEFYTSEREDGKGSADAAALSNGSAGSSYKLDSIRLFNKPERLSSITGATAVPIKTVIFTYDYSLCPGIPNSINGGGKLTLRAISMKFGSSDVGYLSPYRFNYDGLNPSYGEDKKDMWGSYKPNTANMPITLSNHEFPYVKQDQAAADLNASAWNLTRIRLPSGGAINVTYEADDYSHVQDRRAMEMFKVAGVGPSTDFVDGNSLYQSPTNPYLYVYFERKADANGAVREWFNDMRKAYLGNGDLVQYNFKVKMSSKGEKTASCDIPLEDYVKGYAAVESIGICDNAKYGYIKLEPKNVDKMPSLSAAKVSNLSLHPATLSAIFYARYYNNKALYPASEILSINDRVALVKQLVSAFTEISSYFKSPLTKYLKDGRARYIDLDQSYIRLCSQGKKLGGGHRVKRIEFTDNWNKLSSSSQPVATYGSEYNYTLDDDKLVSSGVATYEPLFGGDENPFKEPIATDRIGQKKDFPVVIPTELIMEGPIGESMYPPADVGYSRVTVTSIHKTEGASSQTISVHEFYTAREFPVRTANTTLEKMEDKRIKALDMNRNKTEAYRVGQGYSLFFNDMHGKSKKESIYVSRGDKTDLVSFKRYEYFTNPDNTLDNNVPCLYFDAANDTKQEKRVLGVETDIMLDSREKLEKSRTTGFMANLNIFMIGVFPIPIPTAFPKFPKSVEKAFSSIVSTKIIQQYGILKSVETFDKGAEVKLSNELFDANTGLPLVTRVNTEHKDYELQVKYPAYWAYRCMGAAYKNIGYEEQLKLDATIVDDALYFTSNHPDRFNLGDELLFTLKRGCNVGATDAEQSYKLWVVGKDEEMPALPQGTGPCNCPPTNFSSGYKADGVTRLGYHNTVTNSGSAEQDPRYTFANSLNGPYVPATSVWIPAWVSYFNGIPTSEQPWITGNATQDTVFFKTTINLAPNNLNSIMMLLRGDGYDKKDPSNPSNACMSETALYVNGQYKGEAIPGTWFHPQGLVLGNNTIIVRLCNANGPVAFDARFESCPTKKHMIKALPRQRGAESGTVQNKFFPNFGRVYRGDIKVIRSGRRNLLQETVQDLTILSKPGTFDYHAANSGMNNVLAINANTFTDEAAASGTIADPATVYHNPYVTGRKGNYRTEAQYNMQTPRSYAATTDPGKGVLNAVRSFWKRSTPGEYHAQFSPDGGVGSKWFVNMWVNMYSPWGNDLEVQDAAGNIQSNIFGYGNTLPVATVKNSAWNDALYEHFEDYSSPGSLLNFYQNGLQQHLRQSGTPVSISNTAHSGTRALTVNSLTSVNIPVSATGHPGIPSGGQSPFYFRPGKKYLISYWQQTDQNTANLTSFGMMALGISGTTVLAYPKTPVIDGWMLYEREFTVPANLNGSTVELRLGQSVLDDIRIVPFDANMKSYVYHPVNRKLVASLDENHMASFFEYDAEGKLVRIKKETEKGILTLKESRGALQHILNTTTGNGTINLKD
jgi:hypothetical protein